MRRLLCLLPLFFFHSTADADSWEAQSEEESLFIRRIADFWQEGEYQIVKKQIEEFLQEYPESSMAQSFNATLGDLYLREKNYQGAMLQYARIDDPALASRTFLNRMQCLFELQWFATLADECEDFLKQAEIDPDHKLRATYFLAIALYQQCLNAPKESGHLQRLAERARPYFQLLLKSDLSQDVAQAFAHLSCILKDYASASRIYLRLAEQEGFDREEMLFQAALLQAEYDKPLAMLTFDEISSLGERHANDAVYNRLVLSYDLGQYEEVLKQKDAILAKIPPDRQEAAHLFFGRSLLHLKKYPEALQELQLFANHAAPSELLRTALADILETAYLAGNADSLKRALDRLLEFYPEEKRIPKGILAYAELLKKNGKCDEALQELESIRAHYSSSDAIEPALFEEIQIEHQKNLWAECSCHSREFIRKFPGNALVSYAWRYLVTASARLIEETNDEAMRQALIQDLESMLAQNQTLTGLEYADWSFLLAKTCYETSRFTQATDILQRLAADENYAAKKGNVFLLLSLCDRDGRHDYREFCKNAELALSLHPDLTDEAFIHIALFNGYLASDEEQLDLAAEHLFAASQSVDIEPDNLLWLADYYYGKMSQNHEEGFVFAQKSFAALEKFLAGVRAQIHALDKTTIAFEGAILKMAELHGVLGRREQQTALLESLKRQQEEHPSWAWSEESRVDLMLAENYVMDGRSALALKLLDQITARNPTLRTFVSAQAALESARLRIAAWMQKKLPGDHPDAMQIAAQLKTLILQKNLANEPVHLEAAIEYVDFQTVFESGSKKFEKRLSLLSKIKSDFENTGDLLSRDYQKSRKKLPEKDRIYQAYMTLIDAAILHSRSYLEQNPARRVQLRESAKNSLQEIIRRPLTAFLLKKAQSQLEQMESQ